MNLRWNDVDLVKSEVVVRESKTLAGRRVVPLSEFCKAELVRWRELTGPEFSAFVFPNLSNPSKPLRSVRKTWSTAFEKCWTESFSDLFASSNVCHQAQRSRREKHAERRESLFEE
jgi:integrase